MTSTAFITGIEGLPSLSVDWVGLSGVVISPRRERESLDSADELRFSFGADLQSRKGLKRNQGWLELALGSFWLHIDRTYLDLAFRGRSGKLNLRI